MSMMQIWVIRRRKFGGNVWHYGVLLPYGVVVEFSEAGLRFLTPDQFGQGQDVEHHREVPVTEYGAIQMRIAEFQRNPQPYELSGLNCEKFANWLAGDKQPVSEQVTAVAGAAALIALFLLFARAG